MTHRESSHTHRYFQWTFPLLPILAYVVQSMTIWRKFIIFGKSSCLCWGNDSGFNVFLKHWNAFKVVGMLFFTLHAIAVDSETNMNTLSDRSLKLKCLQVKVHLNYWMFNLKFLTSHRRCHHNSKKCAKYLIALSILVIPRQIFLIVSTKNWNLPN